MVCSWMCITSTTARSKAEKLAWGVPCFYHPAAAVPCAAGRSVANGVCAHLASGSSCCWLNWELLQANTLGFAGFVVAAVAGLLSATWSQDVSVSWQSEILQ